jgi:hypothetical protein
MDERAPSAIKRYQRHIGQRFGDLALLSLFSGSGEGKRVFGVFECLCGIRTQYPVSRMLGGKYRTHCGCKTDKGKSRTHGMRQSPEYQTWTAMKGRCCSPSNKDYPRYGAQGIGVCEAWIMSFSAFFEHVGPRPKGTTLDRVNPSKGYEPGNVRWATPHEQARNRKDLTVVTTPLGTMALVDYAEQIGISKGAAHLRLKRGKLEGVTRV